MGFSDDALSEGFDQQPVDPFNPPKPKSRPWFDLEDIALAIPRGVVGAAKGAYNLADTLSVDSLPDWNSNPLGESKSVVGGWVEGAAHFTAGFVPFGGGLGLVGLIPKAAAGAKLLTIGRVAAASAAARFVTFDGHEARLADLVEKNPTLSNPVTEFLASNPDDPELLGRLKGALEEAALGAAAEGIILGVKAVARGRSAKADVLAKGGTPEQADEAATSAAAAVATPDKMRSAAYLEAGSVDEGVTLARDNAREYASRVKDEFLPPPPQQVTVDPAFAGRLADAYEAMPHNPADPAVQKAYAALKSETLAQFDFMAEKGVKVEPWAGKGEPYKSSAHMRQDVRENNHLWFLTTDATGLPKDHPLAAPAGRKVGGKDLVFNDVFRAVHDYFGHAAEGNKFGPRGEEVAWQFHARMYSDDAIPALTTETRGQNSWVNFSRAMRDAKAAGKHVPLAERPFAEQKAGLLPGEFYTVPTSAAERHARSGASLERPSLQEAALRGVEDEVFAADAMSAYPDLPRGKAQLEFAMDEGRAIVARAKGAERRAGGSLPEGQPEKRVGERRTQEPTAAGGSGGAGEPPRTAEAAATPPEPTGRPGIDATPAQRTRLPMLRALGLTDEKVAKFTAAFEEKAAAIEAATGEGIPGRNPRTMSAAERLEQGLLASDLPMQHFRTPEQAYAMSRTMEDFFRTEMEADVKALAPQTVAEMTEKSAASTAEMLGYRDVHTYVAAAEVRAGRTLATLGDLAPKIQSDRALLRLANQRLVDQFELLERVRAGEVAGSQEKIAVEFGEALQHAAAMKALAKGQAREVGRLLRAYGNTVGGVDVPPELLRLADDPVRLKQTLLDMGGLEKVTALMDKYRTAWSLAGPEGGDAALQKMLQATYGRRFLDMTTEFFMGSVLSSPQTWVINAVSSGLSSVFLPLERALGSAMIRVSGGRLAPASELALQEPILRESLAQVTAIKESFRDGFRMFKDSGWSPESALTGTTIADPGFRAGSINAANVGLADASVAGQAVNWIGKAARTPMNILGGTDVVAKNTIYRAAARARLQTEALQSGFTDPVKIAKHVEDRLAQLVGDGQAYTQKAVVMKGIQAAKQAGLTDPDAVQKYVTDYYGRNFDQSLASLSAELVEEANVATFTNRQLPGTISHSIQKFVNNHPALKLVAPFINTPVNLLKGAGQRADAVGVTRYIVGRVWPKTMPEVANTSNRFLRDMLSGDPRKAADAVGRVSVGMGAAVFFTSEALAGNVTGHGPSDPQQRQALMDTGWQPYSFRVGDGYVSYARLDPFGVFIGTAADMAEYMNNAEDVQDEDHATAITGLAIGMANNFTNKSYLTGFANLVGALQAPEKKLPEFFRRQAAAFVPNILGTAGYGVGQDPNLREVRSFTDAIMAKVPGLSDKLPPRRNILGEPLERPRAAPGRDPAVNTALNLWDPIKYSRVKDDVVRNELAALGHAWEPPKRRTNGVDLMEVPAGKTTAYDRWQELQGTVSIGGVRLKDALRREMLSPAYKRLTPEAVDGLESPRVGRVSRIVAEYRARAWRQLLQEVPALKTHDTAYSANKHRLRAGLPASIIPGIQ